MNYIEFKNKFKEHILLSKKEILLNFNNFDNKNLTYWQKKGYIKKIIKNYYYFSDTQLNREKLFYISNNLHFPAYISSYSALNYYSVIPEQVSYITGVSTNPTKTYKSDVGIFKYHNLKKELFWGYEVKNIGQYSFYIADIEKTILDFFYFNKHYKTKEDIKGLRINISILKEKLNSEKLLKYLKIYNNKTLEKTIFILLNMLNND